MSIIKKISTTLDEQTKTARTVARKSLLVSLGAAGMAKDTASKNFATFIRRGEKVEQLGRKQIQQVEERVSRERIELNADIREARVTVTKSLDKVLGRLNLPTSSDMAALDYRIGQLSTELHQLLVTEEQPIVTEPIEGYSKLKADDVISLLPQLTLEQVQHIRTYEATHANRVTVLREADRLLSAKFHEQTA